MKSCQGYPIWVHANTNDTNWADRMKIACEETGCHYFSSTRSNGNPGFGKNLMMKHFGMDTNLRFFSYCFLIDGDDAWGSTLPELFKRKYDGDFLFSSGGKYKWKDEIYEKVELAQLSEQIRKDMGDKYDKPTSYISEWLDLRELLQNFYQHPNNEHGTLNRLIGFHKGSISKLQFKEDIRIAEDLIFHIEALMADKRKEFKIQYLHDDELYLYQPNERGIHYYSFSRPKENWLAKVRAYLPKAYPKSLNNYKVDWIK